MDEALLAEGRPAGPIKRSLTTVERQTLEKSLEIVSTTATRLKGKGLSTKNFTLGVSNCLFVAWSFGCIPQHFWIVYILEACVLFPVRFSNQASAKPSQVAYWLDLCWVSNFTAMAGIVALFLDHFHVIALPGTHFRKHAFAAAWGIGCGPLLLAGGLLGNALIFHDADNVASVLIHLFPALVLHTMRFDGDAVHKAWPFLHLDYLGDITGADILFWATAFYLVWATLYLLWLVSCGMSLPRRGYDTIFHYNMRASLGARVYKMRGVGQEGHSKFAKSNDFRRSDAVIYMALHAVACFVGILTTLPSFWHVYIHGLFTLVVITLIIHNGAQRYTYYTTELYSKMMKEALNDVVSGGGS